uniref:AT-hook transcription factor n=1 Tax=Oryctolagus cuniculus TaxID=9986 RepID=A0A5F9D7T4_RABIT
MASTGAEAHWAEPSLGQGFRRRRWAWATEEKGADKSGPRGWGEERPSPGTPSPELLEDFLLAQPHLLPPEWGPDLQPDTHQDSSSGESSGEETGAEDVDSPAASTLPLGWLPPPDPHLDMTQEEPDEALASAKAEEGGESSPSLEEEAGPSSEGDGDTCLVALGQAQARGWTASGRQGSRNRLLEHSEVNSARSWSSGTVSLGHLSDSLDSPWEGDLDVPGPPALEETLPLNPSNHPLNPDVRTGGTVAPVTPTEFQDTAAPAQRSGCTAGRWSKDTIGVSCPQPEDQTWKRTKTSPKPLPSRFTGSISPMNPRPRPAQKNKMPPKQGATLASHSSSDVPMYGRGRLNYPLPDFSKVGPRVKFPKDESYRPPKSRSHKGQPQGPARPLIFKSPAEIVREVLLSSGEASPVKDPPPAHPITRVPQEFQTPEQATELVHQLQEDYHKLLTKYAEAENTIDQLRLGAKVNLYWDPPQPSHSTQHKGRPVQGAQALSFTIPQPRSAQWWPAPATEPQSSEASGWPMARGDLGASLPPSLPTPGWLPEDQAIAPEQPPAEWTEALASQAHRILAQGFQRLQAAHRALEEEYLKASRAQHLARQLAGSEGTPGKFDPGRELEMKIYHLGTRLEELKDLVNQTQQAPEPSGCDSAPDIAPDIAPAMPSSRQPRHLPTPPGQTPAPDSETAFLESAATGPGPGPLHVNVEVTSGSSEVGDRPRELPALLRCKELQMEQDFQGLLDRNLSVKSLSEVLRMEEEEEEEEEEEGHTLEVDGPALVPGNAEANRMCRTQHPAQAEKGHGAPVEEPVEQMVSLKPRGLQTAMAREGHVPGLGSAGTATLGPGVPSSPALGAKSEASHQSSESSLPGSGFSERLLPKSLHHAGGPHAEEPWMASPETDSGFVGSETSRVSPLTQTPEHRLAHVSTPGTSSQPLTAPVPHDGASHPKARGSAMAGRAREPSTPRSRAQRPLSSPSSPPQPRRSGFRGERAPLAEMATPSSEFERPKQSAGQLLPSRTIGPAPTPAPAAAPLPYAPTTGTAPNFVLSRAGRDQAIRELQEEVSRLRLRLESSLHRPPQGSPVHPVSASHPPARPWDRPSDSATRGSHFGSKSTERLSGEPGCAERASPAGRQRPRSSSVPRLPLGSESEPPSPQLLSEKSRTPEDEAQVARDGMRAVGSTRRPDRVTFRGQYTGQEYQVLPPKAVPRDGGAASCPNCLPVRTRDSGSAATKDPLGPHPTETLRCPLCGQVGFPTEGDSSGPATSGRDSAGCLMLGPWASLVVWLLPPQGGVVSPGGGTAGSSCHGDGRPGLPTWSDSGLSSPTQGQKRLPRGETHLQPPVPSRGASGRGRRQGRPLDCGTWRPRLQPRLQPSPTCPQFPSCLTRQPPCKLLPFLLPRLCLSWQRAVPGR